MMGSSANPGWSGPRTVRRWPTYNLFRRREEPDLVCAVPSDYPVPSFLSGTAWVFAGSIADPAAAPPGFVPRTAEHGIDLNGFHLFHQLAASPRRSPRTLVRAAG
ncbi:hypothetical protein OPKNFCMD_6056 [Methylobacterium crusticola]|uniref:Uncharacterized protein n=1 Tax=Methylobacterium crusticola TaxID=1697972 RepID=A0ABQ4R6H0_9HYPH|nr:hypothetical protein [Methylobacterium crusticola]GJD53281.1 hypothetical protein OPKNFCMD_6056 [Methylobacterium crusticola]